MKILSKQEAVLRFSIDSSNYIHDSVIFIVEDEKYGLSIGKYNVICPGTVIYAGTGYRENTIIGNNNFIGPGCIIHNDALIGNYNVIDSSVSIGFHSSILHNTKIESNCNISNYTTVGSYSFIGTLSPIIKDIKPFSKVFGNPCSLRGFYIPQTIKTKYSPESIKSYVLENITPSDPYLISVIDEFKNQSRKKELK